jgi:hypothetical protein
MNSHLTARSLSVTPWLLGAASLCAQEIAPFDFDDPTIPRNRLAVGVKFAFGISAELKNVSYPGTAAPDYDDGYVRTDISGNAGGKTWYWGYAADSQVDVANDSLLMHTVSSSPRDGRSLNLDDEIMPGVELTYGRVLKLWPRKNERATVLGAEAAISALDVRFATSDTLQGDMTRTTSAFALDGVIPPGAPYNGTFNGPGPLTSATPFSVTSETLAGLSAVDTEVRAHVYGLRLGPFLELPLGGRFSFQFGAGVALMYANTTLEFTETLSFENPVPGQPPASREESFSEGEFLVGFYGRALAGYDFNPGLRLFLGAEYLYLGETSVSGGGKEATLKLESALQGVVGLQLLF